MDAALLISIVENIYKATNFFLDIDASQVQKDYQETVLSRLSSIESKIDEQTLTLLRSAKKNLDDIETASINGFVDYDKISISEQFFHQLTGLPIDSSTGGSSNTTLIIDAYLGLLRIAKIKRSDPILLVIYILRIFETGDESVYKFLFPDVYNLLFKEILEKEMNRRIDNYEDEKGYIDEFKAFLSSEKIASAVTYSLKSAVDGYISTPLPYIREFRAIRGLIHGAEEGYFMPDAQNKIDELQGKSPIKEFVEKKIREEFDTTTNKKCAVLARATFEKIKQSSPSFDSSI